MATIRSSLSTIPLLWRDERSAVRIRAAAWASLVILGTVAAGLLLMSLSDGLYERRAHGRLIAQDDGSAPLSSVRGVRSLSRVRQRYKLQACLGAVGRPRRSSANVSGRSKR